MATDRNFWRGFRNSWLSVTRPKSFAFALVLIPVAESVLSPVACAAAPEKRFQIDIPQGELRSSLGILASETGVSLGFGEDIPSHRTPQVHGEMTIEEALSILLAGSGLRAVRLGSQAFRIAP